MFVDKIYQHTSTTMTNIHYCINIKNSLLNHNEARQIAYKKTNKKKTLSSINFDTKNLQTADGSICTDDNVLI